MPPRRSTRLQNANTANAYAKRQAEAEPAKEAPAPKKRKSQKAQSPKTIWSDRFVPTGDEEFDKQTRRLNADEPPYWLMKAEPESRFENGVDVKFSIDDLAAATEPEPWDGVRNVVARNNMRDMEEGDLAFFYHSNCKVPGIVGIMDIAKAHSVDHLSDNTLKQLANLLHPVSAQDPKSPYFDPKETSDNPKWSLVHVKFRRKFPKIISLKELQKYKGPGGALENLQTLKQSRLSVSRVSQSEWDFILSLEAEE